MENLEMYNKLRAVPQEALKTIGAGRLKGMSDINPMWRIKALTEQFGMCGVGWYVEVVKREIQEGSNGQKVAFLSLNLFVKGTDGWSKAIYGEGGASFIANERNGAYTNDEAFKMAYTDAISICCKMLGMAADIYFGKDRTKYSESAPQQVSTAPKNDRPKVTLPTELINSITTCNSVIALEQIWDTNEPLHKDKSFIDLVNAKKDALK